MSALNNIETSNEYTKTATLNCPPTQNLTVQVNNAAILYQLALITPGTQAKGRYSRPADVNSGEAGTWTDERLLQPGFWNFSDSDTFGGHVVGIRFRSFLTGKPARISASN